MGRAALHYKVNSGTRCAGRVRRIYVRAGVGRYYVPLGWVCDACGATELDDDRYERIAEIAALPANRAEMAKQVARRRQARQRARLSSL